MKVSTSIVLLLHTTASSLFFVNGETSSESICTSENNIFTVHVNLFASELGYYTFEECGEITNPTIGMEVGETYTFVQADRSNYFHPMGFAYFPDGAHDDVDELEPGVSSGTSTCAETMTCPAPMYFLNDNYFGKYSNIPQVANVTSGEDNFGLDDYEPLFFRSMVDWASMGEFSIKLNFDDASYVEDIFYFCHIHQYMAGRIKLLKDGVPVSAEPVPALEYSYDEPGTFDNTCGTFGLDAYQLPNPECPDTFVCHADGENDNEKGSYDQCIDAMNCAMFAGMTTYDSTQDERSLFIHQMIPHHQNAVNMAKTLLNTDEMDCSDITNEDSPDCRLEAILREIVNGQNFQIQAMRGILEAKEWPQTDDCQVIMSEEAKTGESETDIAKSPGVQMEAVLYPYLFASSILFMSAIAFL